MPDAFERAAVNVQDMRYGENPHQQAAFYRDDCRRRARSPTYRQLQGKELSYNNIADADAAWECVRRSQQPALRDRQARQSLRRRDRDDHRDAYRRHSRPIPTSAFGGIIAFNRVSMPRTRDAVVGAVRRSADCAGVPDDALPLIAKKANVRSWKLPRRARPSPTSST